MDQAAREQAERLIQGNDLCVLATSGPDGPYLSLMSYLAAEDGLAFYLITKKDSRKHRNLSGDHRVSLLIDDRGSRGRARRGRVAALSISGYAREVMDPKRSAELLGLFTARHPGLAGLAKEPDLRVIAIAPVSWLLLDGPQKSGSSGSCVPG